MTHYRDLNKELVEQLQAMRVNVKLYCDEIINLKAELMKKHETELFLRKYCYNWAVENCFKLIQTVQPDSDILPHLEEQVQLGYERVSISSSLGSKAFGRPKSSGEQASRERLRSSQLAMEFQRSSSIISSRNSVRSTSPIRCTINEDDELEAEQDVEHEDEQEEEQLTQTRQQLVEIEEFQQTTEENIEQEKILKYYEMSDVIFEESEEEQEEEEEEQTLDIESVYESVEEITLDNISNTRIPLSNITNAVPVKMNLTNKNNSHSKTLRKRGYSKKTINEQDNTTDTDNDMEISDTVSKHIANDRKRGTVNSVRDIEDITLQEPRRCSNKKEHSQLANKSIPTTQNLSRTSAEVTIASPISVNMTLRNFKEVASSTPHSRRNSIRKPLSPSTSSQSIASGADVKITNGDTSCNRRPQRQCKPKNLTEPSSSTKLRNESSIRTKPKKKSKTKGKK